MRQAAAAMALLLGLTVLALGAQPAAAGVVADGWDKLVHAALHAVLCALLMLSLGGDRGFWAWLACLAFGALDEGLQRLHPGRSPSLGDWFADGAGATFTVALVQAREQWQRWARWRRLRRLNALIKRWNALNR
jgi:VanZ family protein